VKKENMNKIYDMTKINDVLELTNNFICRQYEIKFEIERVITKFSEDKITLKDAMNELSKLYKEKESVDENVNTYSFMYDCMTIDKEQIRIVLDEQRNQYEFSF
jgi:hypothetical protein